ncbi:MAG TPA: FAD-dependent oxidoreductase [Candidatus Limnocylindrales bacterium]|nr:FAD-dependent oxidoreductase [Candidatus Limnocylindrales bacterium]
MGYRIEIDQRGCITCGVCMDVCPVEAIDMTRPTVPGVETGPGPGAPLPWMMERPLQVGECIGCGICIRECPPNVMTLHADAGQVPLAARQGPIDRPAAAADAWIPLSAVTREALKPVHDSGWGGLFRWQTRSRPRPWQVWTTMVDDAPPIPIAPCQEACPAGTDAGRYVGLIGAGRYAEAHAVAAEVNPFPSVCGWICTAPCEVQCRRGVLDEPIAIRTLKRFAVEQGTLPPLAPVATHRPERVAIVGGGPAGMSAAFFLARLGYPVTVLEAMPVPGGMMAIGIPEYRLPREVLQAEIGRILDQGVELRLDTAMGRDFTLPDLEREGFRAIFLATGASKSRRLGVPGDELRGVIPATRFLKEVNLGEEPRLSGDVVVVGGGSTAMDAARSARRSGAATVTIAYRRGRADMPAQREEVAAAEREGIAVLDGLAPQEVVGRDGAVVAVRCQVMRPAPAADGAPANRAGARAAWVQTGETRELSATAILVAIGEEPDPSILPEGAGIEVSGWAGIVADPATLATGRAGIFAGGDVVSGPRTIIEAVAAGRRAAASIHEYLAGVPDGDADVMRAVRYRTPPERSLSLDIASRPRIHAALPVVDVASFAATEHGFTEAEAHAEASRCFRCDAVYGCPSVGVIAGRGPADGRPAGPASPDHNPIPVPAAAPAADTAHGGAQ